MKKIIFSVLILTCILFSLSCNPLRSYQKREGCVEFYERIGNQWKYNDSTELFYWVDDPKASGFMTLGVIFGEYGYCAKGMPKTKWVKLLGEPSFSNPKSNQYYYFLTKYCFRSHGYKNGGCHCVIVQFDQENKVASINYEIGYI